ncbi:MAG: hypothetical protein ACI9XZ_002471 [Alphaproteobacteria bacterium]|jgi:hypothetical protein
MSYQLASRSRPGILSVIKGVISHWRQAKHTQYAHPWTAYSPANFQPWEMLEVDLVASNTGEVDQISPISTKNAENASNSLQIAHRSIIAQASQSEIAETSIPAAKPIALRLVSSRDLAEATTKPALPGLAAATGRDFQLAARLASVSALNRKSAPVAMTRTSSKTTGLNRPVKQAIIAKRSRKIEPPAVCRKTRSSAEIVQLRLTRARAEHKQGKTLKIA